MMRITFPEVYLMIGAFFFMCSAIRAGYRGRRPDFIEYFLIGIGWPALILLAVVKGLERIGRSFRKVKP